jgi:hypothetical protein
MSTQLSLLTADDAPNGFDYRADLITAVHEAALIERFQDLEFKEFEFHGFLGLRRVVSFGVHYDFAAARLHSAAQMPAFLLPIRESAAGFAGLAAASLAHALVTEYRHGAGIGWHRDRSVFGNVIGVSLGSACRLRFRRRGRSGWCRSSVVLQPRSAYLLRGEVHNDWQHSIPPMVALRYSITFRTIERAGPSS